MATPFVHTLLPFDTYDAGDAHEGDGVQTVGRTRWTFTLEVAEVTSVTVVLKAGPTSDSDDASLLDTFENGAIVATGTYTLTAPTDCTVQPYHTHLWAEITAQTGDAKVRVTGKAAFLDPDISADADLLSKELRGWSDGVARTVERAERDVRSLLLADPAGTLDLYGDAAGAHGEIREMVVEQAEWLYRRALLARSSDAEAIRTLREMPDMVPGLSDRVRDLRPKSSAYWRGR